MQNLKTKPYTKTLEEMMSRKSEILSKAHSLWLSAANYEEHIAPMLDVLGRELEASIHRISAASCYEKAGDLERAVNLYRAALSGPLRDDTRQDVENMLNTCLGSLIT